MNFILYSLIIYSCGAKWIVNGVLRCYFPLNIIQIPNFNQSYSIDNLNGEVIMLVGTYQHNMDDKNRVFIPAKLRENLGDRFIMSKGIDHCLSLYSFDEWEKFLQKFDRFPAAKVRNMKLYFCGGAVEVKPDSQGRVVIPQLLKAHAGLKKELTITGVQEHAEIWDSEQWNEKFNQITSEDVYSLMEEVGF